MCLLPDKIQEFKKMTILKGNNFSGRTEFLNKIVKLSPTPAEHIYLPPDPSKTFTSFGHTLKNELAIQTSHLKDKSFVDNILHVLGIDRLQERNPFLLSGGEQALAALACALSLNSKIICIDTTLEQLDPRVKEKTLKIMIKLCKANNLKFIMADNRIMDLPFPSHWDKITMPQEKTTTSINLKPTATLKKLLSSFGNSEEISLDNLSFSYNNNIPVFNNVKLSIKPGTIYHLIGGIGTGKSTLSKILVGILPHKYGKMYSGNNDFSPWNKPGEIFAYHFQNPDLQLFANSVQDELIISAKTAFPNSNAHVTQIVDSLLESFGLHPFAQAHPQELPYVLRKRTALASTLAMFRPWTILDEPILGQDGESAIGIASIISQLAKSGRGIIVITHSTWFRKLITGKYLYIENEKIFEKNKCDIYK
jgi:energy-coupling factor transporter ATP-binding protein EcfA2